MGELEHTCFSANGSPNKSHQHVELRARREDTALPGIVENQTAIFQRRVACSDQGVFA
jgi:hypothetical protein